MADPHDQWYICISPFVSADPDMPFNGRKGVSRVRGTDPIYRRWSQFVAPITSSDRSAVEEAVAVPGRKR